MTNYSISTSNTFNQKMFEPRKTGRSRWMSGGVLSSLLVMSATPAYAFDATPDIQHGAETEYVSRAHIHNPLTVVNAGNEGVILSWLEDSNKDLNDILNQLSTISSYKDNWDGYGAVKPSKEVLNNADSLLRLFVSKGLLDHKETEVSATPYGTILLDIETREGLFSIEISENKIGYFTDYTNGKNYGSEGINTDFQTIPDVLSNLLS